MKRVFFLLLGMIISAGSLIAQGDISRPIVVKAAYFDVSPPLRDMVQMDPGEIDRTWKDGVVKNNLYPFGRPTGDDPDGIDPTLQTWFGPHPTDTTIQNFAGVSGSGSLVPPDTDGDVGPDHYFQCVNLSYQIFNKSGTSLLGPALNKSIWNGFPGPWQNSNDGDAIVLYDEEADRWLFSQFALPNYPNGPFYEMVAISQTGDPTGTWYRYAFSFPDLPDYPKFGVWHDGYYMSMNRFAGGSLNYLGTGAVAFDRDAMLAGDPNAEMVLFTLSAGNDAFSLLPADCDSEFPPSDTPEYFIYLNDGPDRFGIYEFTVDWNNTSNSTFMLAGYLPVTNFSGYISGGVPQKNTNVKLDAIAGSLMFRLPFRKFNDHWSIVANATVNAGGGVAGIRWWELRKTTGDWDIYQESTYSPDIHYRWMGSIAMDSSGNIALGYSVSSSTLFPSIRYTGRMHCDPLGQMTIDESGIANGGGSQTNTWSGTPSRWGDYSAMVVDPAAEATFWYTQEYYTNMSSASWKTRIGSFSFTEYMCVDAWSEDSVVCIGDQTQLYSSASGGTGTYTYAWTSIPPGFTSNQQNPFASPTEDTKYVVEVDDGNATKNDTVLVMVNTMPDIYAGPDTTYSTTVPLFPTFGTASSFSSLLWTTSGDGTFNNDTVAACLYTPGPGDISNGVVTLTLTAQPLAPCSGQVQDEAVVHFDPFIAVPEEMGEPFSLKLMPNPTNGMVTMNLQGLNGFETAVSITTMQGKFIYRELIGTGRQSVTKRIDLSGYPSGIYLVKIRNQQGTIVNKLVIE